MRETHEAADAASLAGLWNSYDAVGRIAGHAKFGDVLVRLSLRFLHDDAVLCSDLRDLASRNMPEAEVAKAGGGSIASSSARASS